MGEHSKKQANLWAKCDMLNERFPVNSTIKVDDKQKEVTSPFCVIANSIYVELDGKQTKLEMIKIEG